MKKLYIARVSFDMCLWAEDAKEASDLAKEYAGEELNNWLTWLDCNAAEIPCELVQKRDQLASGLADSLPWGYQDDHPEKTCGELFHPRVLRGHQGTGKVPRRQGRARAGRNAESLDTTVGPIRARVSGGGGKDAEGEGS